MSECVHGYQYPLRDCLECLYVEERRLREELRKAEDHIRFMQSTWEITCKHCGCYPCGCGG